MKISASIVIYNENKETLKKVIDSFLALELKKELIVVDNSPKDDLKSFCENFNENVKYIFSGENLGFGRGHNLAFKNLKEKSDIHMIINPDVYFDSDEICSFLNWFFKEKEISLSTTKVCYPDGENQNIVRYVPTISDLIKRKLKINSGELDIKENTIKEVPFAHGCFFIFKTEVFEKLGGFDERFFMYMEDIDIFIRAKKYGKTVINTNYQIYHEYRKGSSKNLKLLKWHLESAYKFFRKYKNHNLNFYNKIN
jgi:GT2 family glycosyltransferase